MSEVTDVVLPILQRIQADQARLGAKVDDIAETTAETRDEIGELRKYLTYALGLTSQQMLRIDQVEETIKAMQADMRASRGG